ncbi:Protein of unknown function [Klenkia marina]|uniref:DUF4232 domain-containing protein n=1 Tax=Klenkia marina TaxID=1960309 RepID=A0A1G4XCX4_9ACTN|nr:DUF4232 domain-containing protein [Klenkia marina]SCX39001.1 Protein of unknown function [Klenkia marina]
MPRRPAPGPSRGRPAPATVAPALLLALVLALSLTACGPQPGAGGQPPTGPVTASAPGSATGSTPAGAPTTTPATGCPDPGLATSVGPVDGALGLRAVTLTLVNCGATTATVEGYPGLRLLDEEQADLDVAVVEEPDPVGNEPGLPVTAVTLAPGGSAQAVLLWRNTVAEGENAPGSYLAVTAVPGAQEQLLTLAVDLGTTARLVVGPWRAPA